MEPRAERRRSPKGVAARSARGKEQRMARDPYHDFAAVYDEWQGLYRRPFSIALAPLIRKATARRRIPRPVLADLACGTGTFAWWWQRRHPTWTVYGTDRSPAMLRRARAVGRSADGHLQVNGSGPRFLVQDLTRLWLPEPAGILTCLFDSLNHVTREAELLRVFRLAREALAPGGLFIFDLIEEGSFAQVFTGESVISGRDLYVGIETEYGRVRGITFGMARFTFFRRSGPRWRRIGFQVRERCWQDREIRILLGEAGLVFEEAERLDPSAAEEFTVPRRLWICRRRAGETAAAPARATRKSRRAR
jgi:SAM-dependent methyltransferase